MFTGIVEETGSVLRTDFSDGLDSLRISASFILDGTKSGDSVAVNGVCLTVTAVEENVLVFGVMDETLRRTSLGDLRRGDSVNLERPVQPITRMGGHFVQGHVDGLGTVESVRPDGTGVWVRLETAPEILRYVVEKGFIAIDGISLTVTAVDPSSLSVALIPYTREHVAPAILTPGKRVNLEVDMLAKYVEKLVIN